MSEDQDSPEGRAGFAAALNEESTVLRVYKMAALGQWALDKIKPSLEKLGPNVINTQNVMSGGTTALDMAMREANIEAAQLLSNNGAIVSDKGRLLASAAHSGKKEALGWAMHQISPEDQSKYLTEALERTMARGGNIKAAQFLVDNGAKIEDPARLLASAASSGKKEALDWAMQQIPQEDRSENLTEALKLARSYTNGVAAKALIAIAESPELPATAANVAKPDNVAQNRTAQNKAATGSAKRELALEATRHLGDYIGDPAALQRALNGGALASSGSGRKALAKVNALLDDPISIASSDETLKTNYLRSKQLLESAIAKEATTRLIAATIENKPDKMKAALKDGADIARASDILDINPEVHKRFQAIVAENAPVKPLEARQNENSIVDVDAKTRSMRISDKSDGTAELVFRDEKGNIIDSRTVSGEVAVDFSRVPQRTDGRGKIVPLLVTVDGVAAADSARIDLRNTGYNVDFPSTTSVSLISRLTRQSSDSKPLIFSSDSDGIMAGRIANTANIVDSEQQFREALTQIDKKVGHQARMMRLAGGERPPVGDVRTARKRGTDPLAEQRAIVNASKALRAKLKNEVANQYMNPENVQERYSANDFYDIVKNNPDVAAAGKKLNKELDTGKPIEVTDYRPGADPERLAKGNSTKAAVPAKAPSERGTGAPVV